MGEPAAYGRFPTCTIAREEEDHEELLGIALLAIRLRRADTLAFVPLASVMGHVLLGFSAPAGTPPEIVARLNAPINHALADPELGAQLESRALVSLNTTSSSSPRW